MRYTVVAAFTVDCTGDGAEGSHLWRDDVTADSPQAAIAIVRGRVERGVEGTVGDLAVVGADGQVIETVWGDETGAGADGPEGHGDHAL